VFDDDSPEEAKHKKTFFHTEKPAAILSYPISMKGEKINK
jgi:hypothetical protein